MADPRRQVPMVTMLVPTYNDGLAFFVGKLGFKVLTDVGLGGGKRWLVIRPGEAGLALLLAEPANERQRNRIGDQTGCRVGFFLFTQDFAADHAHFSKAGVKFLESPRSEPYGTVAVFVDPFGNKWDLLQRSDSEFS